MLTIINEGNSIKINGVEKFSLLAKNLPTIINFSNNKFSLTNDNFQGMIISCQGKCGNSLLEEDLLLKYSSQNVKTRCIFTENQIERLNFSGNILIYNKIYNCYNLNEFFILISQVTEN